MRTKPMLMGVLALGCACVFGNEAKDLGVNVDGVHLEEADSIKPVVDEKPCELKVVNGDVGAKGKSTSDVSKTDEVKLPYEVVDGAIVLGRSRLPPRRPLRRLRNPEDGKHAAAKISSGTLVIPDVIDGLPVRVIGYGALSDCKGVTSVAIPSSVTNIVDNAFSGFDEIMSFSVDAANPSYSSRGGLLCSKDGTTILVGVNGEVTIPSCVTCIGRNVFNGRKGLKSVTIPSGVTNIAEGVFSGCKEITSFSVDADNPSYSSRDGLLYSKDGTTIVSGVKGKVAISYEVVDGAVVLGAQRRGGSLRGGSLRDRRRQREEERKGVLKGGRYAVVNIPSGVLVIPDVIDGFPVRDIGRGAFSGCEGVTSVTIPSGVTNIAEGVFSGCKEITSFSVDADNPSYSSRDGLLCLKDGATVLVGVNGEVTIPSCVKRIKETAFYGCNGLTSVTMRGERPDVPYMFNIFRGCGKLKSIHVSANAKSWAWMKDWHGIPLVFVKADGTFVEEGDPMKLVASEKLHEPKTPGLEVENLDLASLKAQAEAGDAAAMCELGSRCRRGVDVKINHNESAKWILKAASLGHERAIALCYAWGYDVARNDKEAVKWYRKAVDKGDRCAMNNLGLCYQNGTGVEKNAKEAVKWMRMAADKGLCLAMRNLSDFYYHFGTGDDANDDKESLKWMRMAAEKGDVDGMFGLGTFYYNGEVVDKDVKEAVRWYRMAADKGFARAMFDLGNCYENGIGVETDKEEAEKWYRMAADKGDEKAIEHFKSLEKKREPSNGTSLRERRAELEAQRQAELEAERARLEAEREAQRQAEHALQQRELEALKEELRKAREAQ